MERAKGIEPSYAAGKLGVLRHLKRLAAKPSASALVQTQLAHQIMKAAM